MNDEPHADPVPLVLRRSVLYLPGANERALTKAETLPADALILDLEDAVAPGAKPAARERVCAAVAAGRYRQHQVTIRINALGTPWHREDLQAAAAAGPAAIVVPKVNSAHQVYELEQAMGDARAPGHTRLWAMLETPAAVLAAQQIASAGQRLSVLVMGTNDLATELGAELVPGRAPLIPALSHCLLAARQAGLTILDGVYNNVHDSDGFESECRQAREYGFDGKTLIHPSQLEPCNRVFTPTPDQVAAAQRVLDAFTEAREAGRGVATLDGRMIENLHAAAAQRTLAHAEAATRAEPGS